MAACRPINHGPTSQTIAQAVASVATNRLTVSALLGSKPRKLVPHRTTRRIAPSASTIVHADGRRFSRINTNGMSTNVQMARLASW